MKSQELQRFLATITPLFRQKSFFYTPRHLFHSLGRWRRFSEKDATDWASY